MKQALVAGIALASVLTPLSVSAVSLSGLYVFGDSLSDAGNTFRSTFNPAIGTGFPPPPYAARLSNGPVWVEYLGQQLGLTPTLFADAAPSPAGVNFAFAGATTGTENTLALTQSVVDLFPPVGNFPGLQQQVDAFVSQIPAGGTADPDALYVVWAGATDYLPTAGTFVPAQSPEQPIANLTNALRSLDQAGAKNILLVNLPPLGDTPLLLGLNQQFPGASAALNTLVGFHNQALQTIAPQLSADVNLIPLDVNGLFNQVATSPSSFGFTNLTAPCLNRTAGTLCSDPNGFLFWDEIHPTTAAHQQIGEFAFTTLQAELPADVPEPAASLGLLLTSLGAGVLWRRRAG